LTNDGGVDLSILILAKMVFDFNASPGLKYGQYLDQLREIKDVFLPRFAWRKVV